MRKPISIVQKSNLTDYESLRKHKKIVRLIEIPYNYVFFEFWDDAFLDIYNKEKKYYADPVLKEKAIELRDEENALIKPLYDKATSDNFVTSLGFWLNRCAYEMPILRKERFIETMYGKVDPIGQDCTFEAIFKELNEKNKIAFEKVINDWKQWASGLSLWKSCQLISYDEKMAIMGIHFNEKFEDALAALIIMLNHTRLKTGVVKVIY